jgi:hypothetical protein
VSTVALPTTQTFSGSRASPHARQILFASPACFGELLVTRRFWDLYAPENCVASFASMEQNPPNPWLVRSMQRYGFPIERSKPASLFQLASRKSAFDAIICMGPSVALTQGASLLQTMHILFGDAAKRIFWEMPDADQIAGTDAQRNCFADHLRARIEFEVVQLAQTLEDGGDGSCYPLG